MDRSTAFDPRRPGAGRAVPVTAAVIVVVGVYLVALHRMIVGGTEHALVLALIVAPWIVAAGSALAKRRLGIAATTLALVALAVFVVGSALFARPLAGHVETLLYVENLFFVLSLAWLFTRSLAGDRQPLVTRLARFARGGDMPPSVIRYTRGVTVAWAVFFAAEAIVSTALFFTQSRETWSVFVNLLQWPLVAVAFACEYVVRLCSLRDVRHTSPMQGFRSFVRRSDLPSDAAESGRR